MNEIRPIRATVDALEIAREVLGRHSLPEFIAGYDLELGEVHDEPALWVVFHVRDSGGVEADALKRRSETLRRMIHAMHVDLMPALDDRYPYYCFDDVEG